MLLFLLALLLTLGNPSAARAQQASGNFEITSVNLTSFAVVDNVLRAEGTVTGTLAGLPFTTNITNFALQLVQDNEETEEEECAILNLELGPIHLALLGLFVDTSRICLEITAIEGGGLLGDLLCALAGGGEVPTTVQQADLQNGLTELLDRLLGRNPRRGQGDESVCTGECEILELVLGPLDLTLLGLNISLDDCEGGPVQICISASRGEGILGDLLCALTGPRVRRLSLADIVQIVNRAVALRADGSLSRRDIIDLRQLVNSLASR